MTRLALAALVGLCALAIGSLAQPENADSGAVARTGSLEAAPVASPTPSIGFSPATKAVVGVGQTAYLDVAVADVSDLFGWQIDVTSTVTYVRILDVQRGPFLRSDGVGTYSVPPALSATSTTSKAERAAEVRLASDVGASGSGVIARVRVQGVKKTATAGSNVHIAARKLVDRNAQDLTLTLLDSGEVAVQVVSARMMLPFTTR